MSEFEKPKTALEKIKERKVSFKFRSLLEAAKDAGNLKFGDAAEKFFLESVELEKDSLESVAWELITEAMGQALKKMVADSRSQLQTNPDSTKSLSDDIELSIRWSHDTISSDLFNNPKKLELLTEFRPHLIEWAKVYELNNTEAEIFADKFPNYFAVALFDIWLHNASKFQSLHDAYENNPYKDLFEEELAWRRYHASLEKQLDEPVFNDTFGLRNIYIPLRAAVRREKNDTEERHRTDYDIVNSHDYLNEWLLEDDASIRVVSGGPGSGKSSFAKHFAIDAVKKEYKVLFIPLHLLDFDSDIRSALSISLNKRSHIYGEIKNPFDNDTNDKVLLIFDGLDELSLTSGKAEQSVTNFVQEVQQESRGLKGRTFKFLLLGRTQVVQGQQVSALKQAGTILELLPFYIDIQDCQRYIDSDKASQATDQRENWWSKYTHIKELPFNGIPQKLQLSKEHELNEVTSQPLLNYLVAHLFVQDVKGFDPNQNLNEIYKQLILETYRRPWGDAKHMENSGINEETYLKMLEHVGMIAWHGGDTRTARVKDIIEKLSDKNLRKHFDTLGEGAEKGATRLLTAFYSRKADETSDGDETFELTHKSFGEYLTARKIVTTFRNMHNLYTSDEGMTDEEVLSRWLKVCGPINIDNYLKSFLVREVTLHSSKAVEWQKTCTDLLNYVINNPMPVETLPSYTTMLTQDRNAQEALIHFHSACGLSTQNTIDYNTWFSYELLQKNHFLQMNQNTHFQKSFNNLSFARTGFYANFSSYNLTQANFESSHIIDGEFTNSILQKANFQNAFLVNSNLTDSDLSHANLQNASLQNANLQNANFIGANLLGANVTIEQLLDCESLYSAKLDTSVEIKITKIKPELFLNEKDE